jgi:hypothetical protein
MDDASTAYGAGYVEAYITAPAIYNHASNTGAKDFTPNTKLATFLSQNTKFMEASISNTSSDLPAYWYQVNLVLVQLQGICDGYAASNFAVANPLPCEAMLAINLDGDMEDLSAVLQVSLPFNLTTTSPTTGEWRRRQLTRVHSVKLTTCSYGCLFQDPSTWYDDSRFFRATRCSAIIKVLDNNEDIFISQDTWSSLNSMVRIMKRYNFAFRQSVHACMSYHCSANPAWPH